MIKIATLLTAFLLLVATPASAQVACDASCSQTLDVSQYAVVDGSAVAPGSNVCLRSNGQALAGLVLDGFVGTDASPITIRPCGSTVDVGTSQSGSLGIEIHESQYIRLTGDGGASAQAVHVLGGATGGPGIVMGIGFSGCSSHVELDHIEVNGTSYTALRNHVEDTSCPVRSGFSVHDNHFHDLGGEGMFQAINDGTSPYHVKDVSVRNNLIERAGYQGIKIGVTVDGCLLERNVVIDSGFSHTAGEDTGLALGAGCTVRSNVVLRSSASMVFAAGNGNSYLFENNVLSGTTQAMTFQQGVVSLVIAHNTIVGSSDDPILLYGTQPGSTQVIDNLFVASAKPLGLMSGATIDVRGNMEIATVEDAHFSTLITDPSPYELAANSPAVDAGVLVDGITQLDFLGRQRDMKPDPGAQELGAMFPMGQGGAGGTGSTSVTATSSTSQQAAVGSGGAGGQSSGAPTDSKGCAVSPRSSSSGAALFLTVSLSLLLMRRRSTGEA